MQRSTHTQEGFSMPYYAAHVTLVQVLAAVAMYMRVAAVAAVVLI